MPGPGPFPGFSMDHFNYGYQQGQQQGPPLPGADSVPQPYDFGMQGAPQDSSHLGDPNFHAALQQAIDQTPGLADAMQQDPQLQQHILQTVAQGPGALQGAQGGGLPPGGAPGAPPQAPPQAAPGGHQSFKDYLNSPEGHDSAMMGLIFARMGQHPDQALQMALQFKEQRDRRMWMAQQATQAQEATRENVKLRGEYQKQIKEDADQRTLGYKIDSARKDIAALGGEPKEVPDDPAAWPTYLTDLRNQLGQVKKAELDKKDLEKDRKQAFSETYKTGHAPDKYKDDPMIQAAAQMAQDRNARAEERLDIQRSREAQLAKIRDNKAALPDMKLQAQALNRKLTRAEKDISRYEQNIFRIESNNIYPFLPPGDPQRAGFDREIEAYQKKIDALEETRSGLDDKWDDLVNTRGEKTPAGGPASATPSGTAIKDILPQSAHAPTGAEAAKGTFPTPSEKAIRNFKIKAQAEGVEAVTKRWKAVYGPDAPVPSLD